MRVRSIQIYNLEKGLAEIEKHLSRIPDNCRYVGAVAGGSGSGKSKITNYLASRNPRIMRLSLDDYFTAPINKSNSIRDYDSPECYNLPRVNLDVRTLKLHGSVEKPTYDKATHDHGKEILTLRDNGILLIEGLHALNDMVCGEVNFGIFVRADEDTRLERRLERDLKLGIPRETILKIWEVVKLVHYKEIAPTEEHANIIINNDEYSVLLDSGQATQSAPKTF